LFDYQEDWIAKGGGSANFEILDCNTDGILWDCNILILKQRAISGILWGYNILLCNVKRGVRDTGYDSKGTQGFPPCM
jgi:hypothetical protein